MYVLIKDFQYTDSTRSIMILPTGTRFEREEAGQLYFKIKNKEYSLEVAVAKANPHYFKKIDFRVRLTELLKAEKTRTAPKLAELVDELVRVELIADNVLVPQAEVTKMLLACYHQYTLSKEDFYLTPLKALGYTWDEKGFYAP